LDDGFLAVLVPEFLGCAKPLEVMTFELNAEDRRPIRGSVRYKWPARIQPQKWCAALALKVLLIPVMEATSDDVHT
jgi:hypothetical protein